MNYGLQLKPIKDDHFVFGDAKLGDAPILNDGQWDSCLPVVEYQNIGTEVMACTLFALLNAVETMLRQKYGATDNFSDRFLAYISGTTHQGNDPHTVAEALRTKGDVLESDYPYTKDINTWEKFYAIPPQYLYTKALEFIAEYNFGHSWVTGGQQSMMDALNYSPLTAGVYAWELDPQTGYYTNKQNLPAEHDVMIYGYERNNYWKIFDSYSNEVKKLAWDFPFVAIKRYTLNRQIVNPSSWDKFLEWMNGIIDSLQRGLKIGDYHPDRTLGAARSPLWGQTKRNYEKLHPKVCAVHGGTKKIQLHHRRPFHSHPELENDLNNLIWLCEEPGWNCHLNFGHWRNFKDKYNPHIEEDAGKWLPRFTTKIMDETL